jgi:hypothetical protein
MGSYLDSLEFLFCFAEFNHAKCVCVYVCVCVCVCVCVPHSKNKETMYSDALWCKVMITGKILSNENKHGLR